MFSSLSLLFLLPLFHSTVLSANLDCSVDALQSFLPSNTTITLASPITKFGHFSQNGVNISVPGNAGIDSSQLPICVLNLLVQSSANTSFNTGVLLPNDWNGRLMATGNPGFGGGVRWSFQANVLKYGPAVTVSTDTGHIGAPGDIDWAINNPESIIDWAWRSLHESTVLAKTLAKAFYGNDVAHSYYTACSNGGRQGLKEVQMFPDDYDGVLAGAPPWQITHLHPWAIQLGLWNLPANKSSHIDSFKFPIIADLIMDQCDAQDGLVDGIIQEPYSCNFDSLEIMCNSTTKNTTSCLDSDNVNTLSLFYNDWTASDGSLLFPRFPISASASRYGEVVSAPDHFGLEYFYGFVYNSTSWDWSTFDGEKTVDYANSLNTGDAAALDMDLTPFKENGGKLIMYHGLSDTTIPTGSSINYVQGVNKTMGEIDDFFQLYLVPGMGHCGESEVAPYYIAAAGQIVSTARGNGFSVPGYVDPQHDVLLAMMNWVENGTAPTSVIATKFNNDTLEDGISMQRPLCPYPQKAVYGNNGDWHNATSWACQGGDLLEFPNFNGSFGGVAAVNLTIVEPDSCIDGTDDCFTTPNVTGAATGSAPAASSTAKGAGSVARVDVMAFSAWALMVAAGFGLLS